ncbi:hypothetical protein [Vibrio crassostreae]|uniref:hypothetical protein n=1 Tax=Vibrio crassostreae TaxID=246167 RepID=UPI001B30928B|nr:hypothetical protein [Vibrio crassostreae]CAK2954092.1 AlpA family transcriptional regulator [Vibrio crassostreae]
MQATNNTVEPLFISRKAIGTILGMKPTTLDAFIARTEDFPEKKYRGNYSRKQFNEWCRKQGL